MQVKFTGPEHVREVQRAALGVNPDSDELFVFDASNNWIQEMDEEEAMVLHRGSGGTWARVQEGTSEDSEETPEAAEETEMPVYVQESQAMPPDVIDESASESAEPEEATESTAKSGKSSKA